MSYYLLYQNTDTFFVVEVIIFKYVNAGKSQTTKLQK